jgi:hypothetical protein
VIESIHFRELQRHVEIANKTSGESGVVEGIRRAHD